MVLFKLVKKVYIGISGYLKIKKYKGFMFFKYTTEDFMVSKIFMYTEILKSKIEKLLTEKANKISELKFKLL